MSPLWDYIKVLQTGAFSKIRKISQPLKAFYFRGLIHISKFQKQKSLIAFISTKRVGAELCLVWPGMIKDGVLQTAEKN